MYSHFVGLDFTLEERIHGIRSVYCFLEKVISEYLPFFSHDAVAFTVEGSFMTTKPCYASCKTMSSATMKTKNCFNYSFTYTFPNGEFILFNK